MYGPDGDCNHVMLYGRGGVDQLSTSWWAMRLSNVEALCSRGLRTIETPAARHADR